MSVAAENPGKKKAKVCFLEFFLRFLFTLLLNFQGYNGFYQKKIAHEFIGATPIAEGVVMENCPSSFPPGKGMQNS